MARETRYPLLLVFLAVLVRTAWLSDDALITLRSVLNATHGFGLTFNIDERVQSFTHPLWALALTGAYLLVGNIYIATFALSIVVSLLVFRLVIARTASAPQAWLAVVVLLLSRAFVDFSTSGLENPLSNLLLVLFIGTALAPEPAPDGRRRSTTLWLLAGLLYLCRPDHVVMTAPVLALAAWRDRQPHRVVRAALPGLAPAIAWTLFATVYYGFPLPNTAYAKLGHGVSAIEILQQGVLYLIDSLDRDPITLTATGLGIGAALAGGCGMRRALAVGALLYLGWVVSVGGDFMAGRFLVLPLVCAVVLLGSMPVGEPRRWVAATAVLGLAGLSSMQVPLLSDSRFDASNAKPNGIVDERGIYFQTQSLVRAERLSFAEPDWPHADDPRPARRVAVRCGLLGAGGMESGPWVHLIDECALADPLLARLPSVFNTAWRIGHFRRMLPDGYVESVETGTNRLRDPRLAAYYEQLRTITRGPLLSMSRLAAIWRMNWNLDDDLVDRRFYRHMGSIAPIDAMAVPTPDGTTTGAGVRPLDVPLAVTCEERTGRRYIAVALDADDRYLVEFVRRNRVVATLRLGPIPEHRRPAGLATYIEDIPAAARRAGFDTIIVAPRSGERYLVGHVLLDGEPATQDELMRLVAWRDGASASAPTR